jgi:hypothetical protein
VISNTISPLCSLSSLFWAPVKPDEQAPRRTKANARTGPAAVRPRSLLVRVSDFRLCREHRASVGDNLGTFIFKGVRKKRHSVDSLFAGAPRDCVSPPGRRPLYAQLGVALQQSQL